MVFHRFMSIQQTSTNPNEDLVNTLGHNIMASPVKYTFVILFF